MRMFRFRRLLAAHGGDPARWPEAMRPAAEELLRGSAKARAELAAARALDAALAAAGSTAEDEGPADDVLVARILSRAAELPQEPRLPAPPAGEGGFPFRRWLLPQAAGLAAAALAGLVVGWSGLMPVEERIDLSDFAADAAIEEILS